MKILWRVVVIAVFSLMLLNPIKDIINPHPVSPLV